MVGRARVLFIILVYTPIYTKHCEMPEEFILILSIKPSGTKALDRRFTPSRCAKVHDLENAKKGLSSC